MPPTHAFGPPFVGAVLCVVVLLSPLSFRPLTKTAIRFVKPRKCPQCLGVGNNLCCHCKGRGKQGGVFTGVPLRKCSVCDGRGRQLCLLCKSSGLSNHWLYRLRTDRAK